jgi:hypothetical protein
MAKCEAFNDFNDLLIYHHKSSILISLRGNSLSTRESKYSGKNAE